MALQIGISFSGEAAASMVKRAWRRLCGRRSGRARKAANSEK
jgi:hypothetical protein